MDPEGKGYIMATDVHQLLRTLHLRPTVEELAELFAADPVPATRPTTGKGQSQNSAALSAFSVSAMMNSTVSTNSGGSGLFGASALQASTSGAPAGPPANQRITFDKFVSVLTKRLVSDFTPDVLRQSFEVFETNDMPQGVVSTEVLAHALMTYGSEKLSQSEVEKLLSAVDPQNTGYIYYREFVDLVMGEL
ncbi:calmodulin [Strigomonas culicis]|nr:calmodulin [Strigomonas culicis]|eukprot:EPY36881.1 calmodulin [Strigomonas culicis]